MIQIGQFIVVDDDPTNNLVCQFILRRNFPNADIQLFTEPLKALNYIKEEYPKVDPVDVILLLDINMPILSGWEFLDAFAAFSTKIHSRFSIFIVSSSVDERDKEQAERNPFVTGFLCKPLAIETLKQLLAPGTGNPQTLYER